jgi:hypothetical protein
MMIVNCYRLGSHGREICNEPTELLNAEEYKGGKNWINYTIDSLEEFNIEFTVDTIINTRSTDRRERIISVQNYSELIDYNCKDPPKWGKKIYRWAPPLYGLNLAARHKC